jgi:hypothetical protein
MQEVRSYVGRGRSLESASTDQLNSERVSHVRERAADPQKTANLRRDDIQAELTLRGLEPPDKLVQDELNAITEAAAGVVAEMDETAKEELNSEVMNFIRQEKSRSD